MMDVMMHKTVQLPLPIAHSMLETSMLPDI
jgi:hypothetical protein